MGAAPTLPEFDPAAPHRDPAPGPDPAEVAGPPVPDDPPDVALARARAKVLAAQAAAAIDHPDKAAVREPRSQIERTLAAVPDGPPELAVVAPAEADDVHPVDRLLAANASLLELLGEMRLSAPAAQLVDLRDRWVAVKAAAELVKSLPAHTWKQGERT